MHRHCRGQPDRGTQQAAARPARSRPRPGPARARAPASTRARSRPAGPVPACPHPAPGTNAGSGWPGPGRSVRLRCPTGPSSSTGIRRAAAPSSAPVATARSVPPTWAVCPARRVARGGSGAARPGRRRTGSSRRCRRSGRRARTPGAAPRPARAPVVAASTAAAAASVPVPLDARIKRVLAVLAGDVGELPALPHRGVNRVGVHDRPVLHGPGPRHAHHRDVGAGLTRQPDQRALAGLGLGHPALGLRRVVAGRRPAGVRRRRSAGPGPRTRVAAGRSSWVAAANSIASRNEPRPAPGRSRVSRRSCASGPASLSGSGRSMPGWITTSVEHRRRHPGRLGARDRFRGRDHAGPVLRRTAAVITWAAAISAAAGAPGSARLPPWRRAIRRLAGRPARHYQATRSQTAASA